MFLLQPARVFQVLIRGSMNMERIIANNRLAEQTIQSLMHEVKLKIILLTPNQKLIFL